MICWLRILRRFRGGYNKRLLRGTDMIARVMGWLARECGSWHDDVWPVDSAAFEADVANTVLVAAARSEAPRLGARFRQPLHQRRRGTRRGAVRGHHRAGFSTTAALMLTRREHFDAFWSTPRGGVGSTPAGSMIGSTATLGPATTLGRHSPRASQPAGRPASEHPDETAVVPAAGP